MSAVRQPSRLSPPWRTVPYRALGLASLWLVAGGCAPSTTVPLQVAADLEQHTVDASGHPLAVWEKSPSQVDATVLLLHGRTWSTVPNFDLQVPGEELSLMDGLNEVAIAAYGVDARGYGATPRDETGWLTPVQAARDVVQVLEWMHARAPNAPSPVLFGWSYGAMVGQLVAQRRPDLISGLVLFGYPTDPDEVRPVQEAPGVPPRTETTAQAAASDFIVDGSISQLAVQNYVEAALVADPMRMDWKDLHQWNELDPARVTVPTLLLEGEFDPLTDAEAHASLFSRLATPDRTWTVIPGGDHAAFLETPRWIFLEAMQSFVHRVGGQR